MCGADTSASHIHLLLHHRGSPPLGCPEDRHFLCGRIWQHALGGRRERNPCALPAGTRTECPAGSLNWSIFLTSTVSIFVSYVRHSLTMVKPSGLPIMSATTQTDRQQGRYSYPGPPWYSPPLSARSRPDPLGGCCHPGHNCRQTGEKSLRLTSSLSAHGSERNCAPVSAGKFRS